MTKQDLEQLIEAHQSIGKMAKATGLSHSTIRYWLKVWGLKSKGKARGIKQHKPRPPCRNCGNPVRSMPNVYCSLPCQFQFRRRRKIAANPNAVGAPLLRHYLIDERSHRCEVCGITEWMGKSAPLELDHKDGDSLNNTLENLRLICPNCHAQTETYKGRNTGKGRHYRRVRYAEGKSY
jgi:Zn finger protein HypA/HybF involved in hydrogenase expression